MSGIDHLVAKSLDSVVRENLGKKAVLKIEKRLFEKYGISLTEGMEQFQKIDTVLREFFGAATDSLEGKFLDALLKVQSNSVGKNWFTIHDSIISKIILESYGDDEKVKILKSVNMKSLIIAAILKECKIPQTSGYRKINALIKDGLLVSEGYIVGGDGKKINKYRALFDNVRINIVDNKITVDVQLNRENFNGSSILQTVYG